MTGAPPPAGPVLRPRRLWYAVAAAVALLGVVAGIGVFVLGLSSVSDAVPDLRTRFGSGVPTPVTLRADRVQLVYADAPAGATAGCTASGEGAVTVGSVPYSFDMSRDGRQWHAVRELRAARDGTYTVTCVATTPGGATYAIGDPPQLGRFLGGLLGGIAALAGLPCLGLVVAGVIALVTVVRRANAKREWELRAAGPPGNPPGPPGTPPGPPGRGDES